MKTPIKHQPAIFYDIGKTYHADSCEPLKNAAKTGKLTLEGIGRRTYPGRRISPKVLPELCLYCVWDARSDQDWRLQPHRNEGIELGYLARGKLDFIVDNIPYKLSSGQLTVTRPWQLHQVGDPVIQASRMHWLILDVQMRRPNDPWRWPDWLVFAPADLDKLTKLLRYNEYPVWQGNGRIEKCFENIAQRLRTDDPEKAQTHLQLYINQLLLEVYEMLQATDLTLDSQLASTRRSVEMFLDALPDHLDYPWTLEAMANHCNLGRTRFAHYCRKITNMSPAEFLTRCRVNKAKQMLKTCPEKSITEIAFACGFESSHYFATVFKKHIHLSPSQFRSQIPDISMENLREECPMGLFPV